MAELPAMPIWTDAYMADCGHLDDAEHGRYLMLLMLIWRSPGQRIPNDNEWLARRFRRSLDAFLNEVRPIVDEFCQCDGNWITQKRLSKEFNYVAEKRKKQSERAKSRWEKEKENNHGNAATGNAPTPTPTPLKKRDTKVSPKEFDLFWDSYPRKKAKGPGKKAFMKHAKKVGAEKIMDGLKRQIAEWDRVGTDLQFIPYPSTWLNAESWDDGESTERDPLEVQGIRNVEDRQRDSGAGRNNGTASSRDAEDNLPGLQFREKEEVRPLSERDL